MRFFFWKISHLNAWATTATIWGLFLPILLQAQGVDAAYERDYKRAIGLFKTAKYALVINDLGPLTARKYGNALTPYAHYYYALASQKLNRVSEARQMLQQLRERFPDWKKMEEVNYLMADLTFREKQFGEALDYLQDLTDPQLKKDADALKKYYLAPVQSLEYLKTLNRQYPKDRTLGIALIDLIQRTSTSKADLELSDQLTNTFGIATNKPAISTAITPVKQSSSFQKGYYNVSVLLPFKLEEFSPNQRVRANQFAYDMYEGMKLAKEKLKQEGIIVNLFAYDLGSDAVKMAEITNNSNFVQSDLIVGPMYSEPAKVAADFAEANKIYLLQPTAVTTELLTNHPNTFLLQSSLERQTTQLLAYAQSLPSALGKKVAIYYGSSRRDSITAAWYKTKAVAAGLQVIDFRKTREKLDSAASIADWNKPAHVALFSSNDNDGNKVVSLLAKRRISAPLMATATAFDFSKASGGSFLNRELYVIDSEFVDNTKPQVRDFQLQYMAKRNMVPSVYAMQGYDVMLFFGRMIYKYKAQLRVGMDAQVYEDDYLLSGFNYQKSNDNQAISILKVEDLRLVLVR